MTDGTTPLSFASFRYLIGDEFTAVAADGPLLPLRLVEAEERSGDERTAAGFTLLFHSGTSEVVEQQTFQVSHPDLGTHPIFLVPVGREDDAVLYEAVFTRPATP